MKSKQDNIINMFDDIARNYDLANRILSLNVDTKWRKEACIKALKLTNNSGLKIIDIACGTGDMILNWLKFSKDSMIIGIDPSINMLKIAKEKLPDKVKLIQGEAKDIAIDDERANILSIAYGLRNVVEIDKSLSEFHRVLRDDGILVILEFTRKDNENLLDKMASFYTRHILPIIGGLISRNYKAYKYLPDSVGSFLTLEELEAKLLDLGFLVKVKKRYTANLCSLIIAQKKN